MEKTAAPKRRMALLDTIRGILIIIMIIFHAEYDLVYMFGASWLAKPFFVQMELSVIPRIMFVALAGITIRFSRDAARHGAKMTVIAACFTLATAFIFPGSAIYFGILHLIAAGMLVYGFCGKTLDRIPWWLGALLCAVIFIFTYNTSSGYFGFEGFSLDVPDILTRSSMLYPFGFISRSFTSADYVPMLPWLFAFLGGVFIGKPVTQNKMPELFYRDICPALTWLGKHSLTIYIIHQPIVYALLYIIYMFI